jgi:DTW domain-containing protein YfiP
MSKRRSPPENRCPNCRINIRYCFCHHFFHYQNKHRLLIIRHFRERHLPTSTAWPFPKLLSNAHILDRGKERELPIHNHLNSDFDSYVLFPDENAQELTPDFAASLKKPIQLIVPDGTWSQARKIKKREPQLKNLPSLKISKMSGNYFLKHSPVSGGVSTFEAIAHAYAILENKDLGEALLAFFTMMIEHHLIARGSMQFLPGNNLENSPNISKILQFQGQTF